MNKRAIGIAFGGLIGIWSTVSAQGPGATATLTPTAGNTVGGTVTFMPSGNGVAVAAKVTGLPPGSHGFHIHAKGDCSAPDASSAGDHYNPTSKPHGDPASAEHHAGDMPMLVADASGNATLNATVAGLKIGSGEDIVGKAVVVHKDPDDFKTQPSGNSGARIACGVIKRS